MSRIRGKNTKPEILEDNPEAREIKSRSENYMSGVFKEVRAFTRYRTIDIDMKKDLVKILEGKQ